MASPGQKPLQNPRHEKFAREYSRHGKIERAVVAAGYECKTWLADRSTSASVQGNDLLKSPKILQRIQYIQENRARQADLTELKLIRELKRIAFFDARKLRDENGDLKHPKDWDDDTGAAVAAMDIEKLFGTDDSGRKAHVGYTVKVKQHDKLAAIDKLMRYFGMVDAPAENKGGDTFNDNRQVNFYLPENPRHAKNTNESSPQEITRTSEDHQSPITLPPKIPLNGSNGHH